MALNYDPKRIMISVGALVVTGFIDGTFVTITPDGDNFSMYKGADGMISRANLNPSTAILKISLAQTSPANDVLSDMMKVDITTSQSTFPIVVQDLSGTTMHTAASCWIIKQPEQKFGKNINAIEWEIQLTGYTGHIGGNVPAKESAPAEE